MVKLSEGQKVKVYDRTYRERGEYDGTVIKVGRKLAWIQWDFGGFSPTEAQFRMDDGRENDGGRLRSFKTLEQADRDDRWNVARTYLRERGVDLLYRFDGSLELAESIASLVRSTQQQEATSEAE